MALRLIKNKKGAKLHNFLYLILYVILTFIVVLLLVQIPEKMFKARMEQGYFPQTVNQDRISTMFAYKNPYSGRLDLLKVSSANMIQNKTAKNLLSFPEEEEVALFVSLDNKKSYYDRKFYKRAKPLVPVRYVSLLNTRKVQAQDDKSWKTLTIEQVFRRT
ncbi:hypothetical protein KY346_03075 [Candidatus Woesearchaeota archaeon]|nr:hypothetical protein [Candidatus Woesearchaeota archaeon]